MQGEGVQEPRPGAVKAGHDPAVDLETGILHQGQRAGLCEEFQVGAIKNALIGIFEFALEDQGQRHRQVRDIRQRHDDRAAGRDSVAAGSGRCSRTSRNRIRSGEPRSGASPVRSRMCTSEALRLSCALTSPLPSRPMVCADGYRPLSQARVAPDPHPTSTIRRAVDGSRGAISTRVCS